MNLVAAVLTIYIANAPMASIHGYVAPSACGHSLNLPRMENDDHQSVTAGVKCEAAR